MWGYVLFVRGTNSRIVVVVFLSSTTNPDPALIEPFYTTILLYFFVSVLISSHSSFVLPYLQQQTCQRIVSTILILHFFVKVLISPHFSFVHPLQPHSSCIPLIYNNRPVKGLFHWCPVCGHGGHIKCHKVLSLIALYHHPLHNPHPHPLYYM